MTALLPPNADAHFLCFCSGSERGSYAIFGFEAFFSARHRSRSTRPVEERHVLRSSRTLFLSSVHPNGLRFPWTLGTLFPGNNQTTQTHTWTQNSSKPNVHCESTIVIESDQPQRPRHPPQRLATAIYFPAPSHQRHDRTRDRPPTKRLLS